MADLRPISPDDRIDIGSIRLEFISRGFAQAGGADGMFEEARRLVLKTDR